MRLRLIPWALNVHSFWLFTKKSLDGTAKAARDNVAGQMSLFDTIEEQSEMQFPNIDELDKKTMLKMEKQSTGL